MKIMETTLKYACGCEYTEQYAKGATKTEVKTAQMTAAMKVCPKCEKLLSDAKELKAVGDLDGFIQHNLLLFTYQRPVINDFTLSLSAGRVIEEKTGYYIGYEQNGSKSTFSIGQPVYDFENNLLGYLCVRLYNNLDYHVEKQDTKGEAIPVYAWGIDKPTIHCKHGVRVQTFWQRWNDKEVTPCTPTTD